jgi:hypothetical protein
MMSENSNQSLRLERVHAGQQPAQDGDLQALRELSADDVATRIQLRPLQLPERAWWWPAGLATATAMAMVLVVTQVDDVRPKGRDVVAPMELFEQVRGESMRLHHNDQRGPGTLVQVVVHGPAAHAAVLSVDGLGVITWHWPLQGGTAPITTPTLAMPHAYELDDAPRFERFLLVRAGQPLTAQAIETALRQGNSDDQALMLSLQAEVSSVVVHKPRSETPTAP